MDDMTRPFKDSMKDIKAQVARIDNVFLAQIEPLERLSTALSDRMVEFYRRKEQEAQRKAAEAAEQARAAEAARQEELARIEAEQAKAKSAKKKAELEAQRQAVEAAPVPVQVVEEPARTIRSASGVTIMKKVWTYMVTDMVALAKYSQESGQHLVRDDSVVINKLIGLGARDPEIPGIEIYQDIQAATRA